VHLKSKRPIRRPGTDDRIVSDHAQLVAEIRLRPA